MAVELRASNGPLYQEIDGFRVNKYFTLDLFRSALKYEAQAGDNFVVTFPKCGTTWTQHIVYLIYHDGVPPSSGVDFYMFNPFLEMFGADAVRERTQPGLIKTHLPYRLVPFHPQAKYIYVCRNPKDCCISFFHHTRGFAAYDYNDGKFENYFDIFLSGETDFGDYFEHVLSWYGHRNDTNVLFIHYEDMKEHPEKFVLMIAKFLDEKKHQLLLENEAMLKNIVEYSDIKTMKGYAADNVKRFFTEPLDRGKVSAGLKTFHELGQRYPKRTGFIRKGVVGEWKDYFSTVMNAKMEEKMRVTFGHTNLIDEWRKHGIFV